MPEDLKPGAETQTAATEQKTPATAANVEASPAPGSTVLSTPPANEATPPAQVTETPKDATVPGTEQKAPEQEKKKESGENEAAPQKDKVVPEKYDLKIPDGSPISAAMKQKLEERAKAQGLSNEEAQAELNRESATATSYVESLNTALAQRQVEWVAQMKNDPELGGARYQESTQDAQRAIHKYGSALLVKELNDTGLGDHPELVRFAARIGALMRDDKTVFGHTQDSSGKSALDVLYDKQPKK